MIHIYKEILCGHQNQWCRCILAQNESTSFINVWGVGFFLFRYDDGYQGVQKEMFRRASVAQVMYDLTLSLFKLFVCI